MSQVWAISLRNTFRLPTLRMSSSRSRISARSVCRLLLRNGAWCLKSAPVADFVYRYAPHRVCSTQAIGCPPIDLIKALSANVTCEDPQNRTSKSESEKAGTSGRHKGDANSPAPLFWIYIKSTKLSKIRHIRVARWRCGCKPMDQASFCCHDRVGF